MRVGFLQLLGLLFIGLKLGGIIAWSWWLVLLPLYLWPLSFVIMIIGMILYSLIVTTIDYISYKLKEY